VSGKARKGRQDVPDLTSQGTPLALHESQGWGLLAESEHRVFFCAQRTQALGFAGSGAKDARARERDGRDDKEASTVEARAEG
jgi:hypothetical protein